MKKRFSYDQICGLHLELTTKCNAMCPMCNRNYKGKIRKKMPILELSLNDIKKIFDAEFIKKIKLISLCGVYGEPICNKDLKQIIKYFYSVNNHMQINLYTNGGLYDGKWWKDLARIMKPYGGKVIFGIDGDENTHQLHRCNTDYNKIISNAKSFIDNGGRAQWDYIVFKHNEDQVTDAYNLSKKLGFEEFQIKKTSRFFKSLYEKDANLDSTILEYGKHPVYDSTGKITHVLEMPVNENYRNPSEKKYFNMIKKYGSISKYLDQVEINCSSINSGGIFVSASGEVFPCCSIYQQICYRTIHDVCDENELNEYKLYMKNNLSAFIQPIKCIVEGAFFEELEKSFNCLSISDGKPKVCARTCGKYIDYQQSCHTKKDFKEI